MPELLCRPQQHGQRLSLGKEAFFCLTSSSDSEFTEKLSSWLAFFDPINLDAPIMQPSRRCQLQHIHFVTIRLTPA